jgi:hypothetical protein
VTERSFDLLLSQASLAGPSPEGETNCVKIGAVGGGRILGGNATATWTAAAPTSETLVLGFRSGYVPKLEEASGASPLSLAIPESMVPPTGPDNGFGMSFDTGQPRISLHVPRDGVGVALRQEVTLTLRIESTGDELEFEVVQC